MIMCRETPSLLGTSCNIATTFMYIKTYIILLLLVFVATTYSIALWLLLENDTWGIALWSLGDTVHIW